MFQSTRPHGTRPQRPCANRRGKTVSIHASAWDATQVIQMVACQFQVSIHASAWDATRLQVHAWKATGRFNPRVRMGRDLPPIRTSHPSSPCFNPRVRMGRDYPSQIWVPNSNGFNPRVRMGRDNECQWTVVVAGEVSIHASAWDATVALMMHM